MTNEEAIVLIGSIQFDLTDGYYQREDYTEALCVFDRLNQENTKLKAEIEKLSSDNSNLRIMLDKKVDECVELKSELEQATKLMPKICETCEHEDEIGWKEPCNSCKNSNNWKWKGKV